MMSNFHCKLHRWTLQLKIAMWGVRCISMTFFDCHIDFIVGSRDYEVVELNETAYERLNCTKKLELVRNATHLFEEEGTLEHVAESAKNWFLEHLHAVYISKAEQ